VGPSQSTFHDNNDGNIPYCHHSSPDRKILQGGKKNEMKKKTKNKKGNEKGQTHPSPTKR
jgi:hypothetical protein